MDPPDADKLLALSKIAEEKSSRRPSSQPPIVFFTPEVVLDKYRRYLNFYEEDEILDYDEVYFFAPTAQKVMPSEGLSNYGFDHDRGRYRCVCHDHIAYRYEILRGLGKGTFGDVVKAYDHKTRTNVAIKIIRSYEEHFEQGQVEIELLEYLKEHDDVSNIVHILDHFEFRNHLCIVLELMPGGDVFAALKLTDGTGLPLPQIRQVTKGVLQCLAVLRRNNIIHCDIKPENILLRDKSGDDVKVIDFGSSCFANIQIHTYVQSRFYRAPETMLQSGYGPEIDIWSLGCMVAELYTSKPLFPGRDENEQLMYQMELLGLVSREMIMKSKRLSLFFDDRLSPRCVTDRKGGRHEPGTKSLETLLGSTADPNLLSFISSCLRINPADRITPADALRHPFIADITKPQSPVDDLHVSLSTSPKEADGASQQSKTRYTYL